MKRIFGGPKKVAAQGPSMDDVSSRMSERSSTCVPLCATTSFKSH